MSECDENCVACFRHAWDVPVEHPGCVFDLEEGAEYAGYECICRAAKENE
jgi:hypothetical protein